MNKWPSVLSRSAMLNKYEYISDTVSRYSLVAYQLLPTYLVQLAVWHRQRCIKPNVLFAHGRLSVGDKSYLGGVYAAKLFKGYI